MSRDEILDLIKNERARQIDLVGSEDDFSKTKNDWTATIGYYLFNSISSHDKKVEFSEFRESLIKAAAIIVAALEHSYAHELDNDNKIDELLIRLKSIKGDCNE